MHAHTQDQCKRSTAHTVAMPGLLLERCELEAESDDEAGRSVSDASSSLNAGLPRWGPSGGGSGLPQRSPHVEDTGSPQRDPSDFGKAEQWSNAESPAAVSNATPPPQRASPSNRWSVYSSSANQRGGPASALTPLPPLPSVPPPPAMPERHVDMNDATAEFIRPLGAARPRPQSPAGSWLVGAGTAQTGPLARS